MIPVKALTLIKETAKRTGLPEDTVKKIVEFYYKSLKSNLTNLDFSSYVLEKFGKFAIKERRFQEETTKLERILQKGEERKDSLTPYFETSIRTAQEDLIKMEKIKKILLDNKQKKAFISLHKETYKNDKVAKTMEGQVDSSKSSI